MADQTIVTQRIEDEIDVDEYMDALAQGLDPFAAAKNKNKKKQALKKQTPSWTSMDEDAEIGGGTKNTDGCSFADEPLAAASPGYHNSNNNTMLGKDLVWSGVGLKLMDKKTGQPKLDILKDVWGKAEAGKTTAIMGASGAGKTSLFQTLAGRVPTGSNLVIEGNIYLGGMKFDPTQREQRKLIAYVSQEDALHESSTPREAIYFSARLRLPKTVTDEQCTTVVNNTLAELGLESAADTIIGGGFKKGISGGEKRRVSIGVELVAKPSLIFLDEPTSGLDSFAAAQVMKLLSKVAEHGNTVLFTIHQPSSNIFSTFDRLILLNKGQVMHQGDVARISEDFNRYGLPVPNQYNPADWIIDVAQTYTLEELQNKSSFFGEEPSNLLADVPQEEQQSTTSSVKSSSFEPSPQQRQDSVSTWKEMTMLQQREWNSLLRNPASIIINVVVTGILSVIFGVIFFDIGRKDRTQYSVIQSQLGAVVNVLIATLMGQSNPAMLTFSKDRPVFLREFSTDHYTIVPYFYPNSGKKPSTLW